MKEWFILSVYSGQEDKVAQLIKKKLELTDYKDKVEIVVPTKKTSKPSKEGKVVVEKKLYPGYIAIQMEIDDGLTKILSRIPGILSFGGKGKTPQKITEDEVNRMFGYIKPDATKPTEIPFLQGETVKVVDGPFADFTGVVEEVNSEKERLKLMITIFGRQTPVEVSFFQVEPI